MALLAALAITILVLNNARLLARLPSSWDVPSLTTVASATFSGALLPEIQALLPPTSSRDLQKNPDVGGGE